MDSTDNSDFAADCSASTDTTPDQTCPSQDQTDTNQSDTKTEQTQSSATNAAANSSITPSLGIGRRNILKTGSMLPFFGALSTVPDVGTAESGFLTVRGINAGEYPTIETTCIVDTAAGQDGEITADAFTLEEEGTNRTIDNFEVREIDRSGEPEPLDIVFVFDDTGSMGDVIDAMQAAVTDFISDLEAANVDGRYGLVSFKQDPAEVDVDQELTDSASAVQAAVDGLSADGGGARPENHFDAIDEALTLDFRSTARQVVMTITDAPTRHGNDEERDASGGTTDLTLADMREKLVGTTFIAIAPPDERMSSYIPPEGGFMNIKRLAEQVDGFWLELPPDSIFTEFQKRMDTVQETLAATRYLPTRPPFPKAVICAP